MIRARTNPVEEISATGGGAGAVGAGGGMRGGESDRQRTHHHPNNTNHHHSSIASPNCSSSSTTAATPNVSSSISSPTKQRGLASASSVVSSFVANQLSAKVGSMQVYQSLKQHHHSASKRNRKGSPPRLLSSSHINNNLSSWSSGISKNNNNSNGGGGMWTVQIPKRMLLSTVGVFLVLPLVIFLWKETHLKSTDMDIQLRGGTTTSKYKTAKNRFVTWMEDNLPEDVYNETEGGAIFLPESIRLPPAGGQSSSEWTATNADQNQTLMADGEVEENHEIATPLDEGERDSKVLLSSVVEESPNKDASTAPTFPTGRKITTIKDNANAFSSPGTVKPDDNHSEGDERAKQPSAALEDATQKSVWTIRP